MSDQFAKVFEEMFGPREGDIIGEPTDDEINFFRSFNERLMAIDATLRSAQQYHTEQAKVLIQERDAAWQLLKQRLGDKWPASGKVVVDHINRTIRELLRP